MHVPERQVSVRVQALASLQAVPLGAVGFEHTPVAGSHVPATWHASEAIHATPVQDRLTLPETSTSRRAPEPRVFGPSGMLTMATIRKLPEAARGVPRQTDGSSESPWQ